MGFRWSPPSPATPTTHPPEAGHLLGAALTVMAFPGHLAQRPAGSAMIPRETSTLTQSGGGNALKGGRGEHLLLPSGSYSSGPSPRRVSA
jgi:hypothetical protein